MRRTLIVTNDFPPRQGGIQSYVHELALRQPTGSIVVFSSDHEGSAAFDAAQPFPVVRHPTGMLLPTPGVRARARELLREHGCTAVWFGASAPLGLLAPALRAAGAERIVASTHGHETGWAMLPGARQALRRIGSTVDVVTYIAEYTRGRMAGAFGPGAVLRHLPPGVAPADFAGASAAGATIRARHGLTERPVIVCVSRLVKRKGQDALIRALPAVRAAADGTALLIVGQGPYRDDLEALAASCGVAEHVVFTGAVPAAELAAHYAAGDVFAMPCRTRRGGLDVEGLGIVFLEASATGLPVVAGDSGGAPEAVLDGTTGYVVGGRDPGALAARLIELMRDPQLRSRLGQAGRAWVEREWDWAALAHRLETFLQD
jgi:phosphatidylinositol alpha-1,6-mannosyltransferase